MQSSAFVFAANKRGSHSRVCYVLRRRGCVKGLPRGLGHFELGGHKDCLEFQGIAGMVDWGAEPAAVECTGGQF